MKNKFKIYVLLLSFLSIKSFAQKELSEKQLDSLSVKLTEITIQAKKKLFEQKVDRLVFNLENSVVSHGVNAFDALRVIPNLDTAGESLKLVGKNNLGLMVNGRLIETDNIIAYLKMIRSDNISKIEVITTPPAKYDAEGNSGLINIVLKKNKDLGFKGTAGTTYRQRTYAGNNPYATVNYKSKKIDISSVVSYNYERKKYDTDKNYVFSSEDRLINGIKKDTYKELYTNFNINYSLNKKTDIGFIYEGTKTNMTQKQNFQNYFRTKNEINSTLDANSIFYQKYNFHSVSLYSDFKIDTLGKKISFNFNSLYKPHSSSNDLETTTYQGNYQNLDSDQFALNLFDGQYKFYCFNLDFIFPLKIFLLEFGAKTAFMNNGSTINFYDVINDTNILDPSKSDRFEYRENINSLYISASKTISGKWSTKFGLRYENTNSQGISAVDSVENKRNFNNLFPSAYLVYSPTENHSFSLSYSKRIDRARLNMINPFRIYHDNYSYTSGNPNLMPSITNNIEFTHIYKNNLRTNFYFSRAVEGMGYLSKTSAENNAIITKPDNYYSQNSFGLDLGYNLSLFKWFNSYNSANLNYVTNSSYIPDTVNDFNGYGAYLSTQNTFNLNKKSLVTINFSQNFPSVYQFQKSRYNARLDLGYRISLLNDNLNMSISLNDVFSQDRRSVRTTYSDFVEQIRTYSDMRCFTFSINYNFGNNAIKNNNQEKYIEEKNRLN
ncbi:outer membrane beta-barrel family protein [uncultured Flavobacterium sp.]|uniref:outer membrane beta-barrel family protein n=1 Tax=uncultured Flavobacterium sp. TaxID=165435 RepID=UPI0025924659|nr:outer membrane beta-barrel family protein [uncultured Flavobacterium sp.]